MLRIATTNAIELRHKLAIRWHHATTNPYKTYIPTARCATFMKIDRHGQAKILTTTEIQLLFSSGLLTQRDRAIFGTCLYTACRIQEAVTLRVTDAYNRKGDVRNELIIRKSNTKGKLATRTIPVIEELR